jgi:DNA-binding response OmpR family regulator
MNDQGIVLLVEDNVELNAANMSALEMCGYEIHTALSLFEARAILANVKPDVILLDVMLPDGNGFDFCREIHGSTEAYIIFLTGKAAHEDMVRGIKYGADTYITKPFHPEEMIVKVESAIRRIRRDKKTTQFIKKGNLTLDTVAMEVHVNGQVLEFSPKEYALLLLFIQNEDKVLPAEQIFEVVWKTRLLENKGALHKGISRVRRKLEVTQYTIDTIYGEGYVFLRS